MFDARSVAKTPRSVVKHPRSVVFADGLVAEADGYVVEADGYIVDADDLVVEAAGSALFPRRLFVALAGLIAARGGFGIPAGGFCAFTHGIVENRNAPTAATRVAARPPRRP